MAGDLQPLDQKFSIVKPDGKPTDYFIRWAQQRQIDIKAGITATEAQALIDDWAAQRDIIAGVGLSGGGSLAADRTIDLEDTAVVPGSYTSTNLTVDQQGRIVAAANGGGAGGGTPAVVQFATIRGNGTITLGVAPTVGNMMVFIAAGESGAMEATYRPADFARVGRFDNGVNNSVMCWARIVQGGDTGAYALSGIDNHAAVLYECSGALTVAALTGGSMIGFFTGTNYAVPFLPSPFGLGNLRIGAFEDDNARTWTITAGTGITSDFITSTAVNHTSAFYRLAPTFGGVISGTISAAPSLSVLGLFAIIGT